MTAQVNTTEVPYLPKDSYQDKPCFRYFNAASGSIDELGVYTISPDEEYVEPVVFDQSGSVLSLRDYQFAYGNTMSDAADNPFLIDVLE